MIRYCYAAIFISFWFILPGYSQSVPLQQLEETVYRLNNELKYNESQARLLPLLTDPSLSADYKYHVTKLLSYTYKRVFDYQSALKFLATAHTFAEQTPNQALYRAAIRSEEAFIYFDTQDYARSDSLMTLLAKNNFAGVDAENTSKLVMQQGYLQFLGKQYTAAEATYDRAIALMRLTDPCDLPMIFVKKMQLYNAMNRLDLLRDALNKSSRSADSCRIIKYHLYANEELLAIYESRHDLLAIAETKQKLDSLNIIYNAKKNISALHNQKETILLAEKDTEIQREQTDKSYLAMTLWALALVSLGLLVWLLMDHQHKRRIAAESERMKTELENYLLQSRATAVNEIPAVLEPLKGLSDRQREVWDCMAIGLSNKEIADTLSISENTVKYHIRNIYHFLEVKDRKGFLVQLKK